MLSVFLKCRVKKLFVSIVGGILWVLFILMIIYRCIVVVNYIFVYRWNVKLVLIVMLSF